MKYFPKINWDKIYLSPINPDDYEIFAKWNNDSRITDWTHWTPRMISLQKQKDFLEESSKNGNYQFVIVKKDDDSPLWMVWLYHIKRTNRTAELWIMIWEFDEHNKWYWTDAINAVLKFAYHTLDLYNICLDVKSFNKKAITCYKKCGFKEIWTRHHCEYCNGERYDLILMEILKPDREKNNK